MEFDFERCVCCEQTRMQLYKKNLVRCEHCGHVQLGPSWSNQVFEDLYNRDYFQGGEYADYEQEESALRTNFHKRVCELAKQYPQGSVLFEIGCAYGYFLGEAIGYFDASGCDIASGAIDKAKYHNGANAMCVSYLDYTPDKRPDIVCLWDVIEHLPDPDAYLRKAFQELNPGGAIVLSTGDIGSPWARIRGHYWRMIHPPTHIHYFSRESMYTLLRRIGYTDIKCNYHPFWRNAGSVLVKLGLVSPSFAKACGFNHVVFPFNLFDIMTVNGKKPVL